MKPHSEGEMRIAVEAAVEKGCLQAVRLQGDFTVRPESQSAAVHSALVEALTGLPINLSTAAIAARLRAAIPFGVELAGTSPEAIARAVHQLFGDEAIPVERIGAFAEPEITQFTDRWKSLPWRLLPERPLPPALNVALDEVLSEGVIAGQPPCLRFWRFDSPAVIVGRCQSIPNEVDRVAAEAMNLQIVRRMTGGGAMFVEPEGAITYSLILPEAALAGLSLRASYEICDAWVIRGLRSLGIDAHHVPINDLACAAGKIGGAAQARRRGIVLHHTTLAFAMDSAALAKVLRIGRARLREKGVSSASKQVSPLTDQTDLAREAVVEHLLKTFQSRFGGTLATLNETELAAAERLVAEKYANPQWTTQFE